LVAAILPTLAGAAEVQALIVNFALFSATGKSVKANEASPIAEEVLTESLFTRKLNLAPVMFCTRRTTHASFKTETL